MHHVMLDVRPKCHGEAIMKVRASGVRLAWHHYRRAAFTKVSSYLNLAAECLGGSRGAERKHSGDDRYRAQKDGDVSGLVQNDRCYWGCCETLGYRSRCKCGAMGNVFLFAKGPRRMLALGLRCPTMS
jgi:hypothetical protein